jgi:HAD superfamily hydrolase (TIGR01450 family)
MTVAVVGPGAMGSRIALRLLETGHRVVVWNRSADELSPLLEHGATAATTPAEAARRADVLVTMVADPAVLRTVTDGADGIAAGADASLTLIEMSTVGPSAVAELASKLPGGTKLVDAPVLGGIAEAEAGKLTIFAGGEPDGVNAVRPLLEQLGTVLDVGSSGSGAAAKLVANAALFGSVALVGESLALARRLGLSDEAAYDVLATTPLARQAEGRRPALAAGDYPKRLALSVARKGAADILGKPRHQAPAVAGGARGYDGLLVDLDGVIWLGGVPIDGVAEAVAVLRARRTSLLFLTNDPSASRAEQAARLEAIGIPARVDDVVTSANATARFLAGSGFVGRLAFVIGSAAFKDELTTYGLRLVAASEARTAELVVVGGHGGFDFAELRAATQAVANGARLYAAGRDRVVPTGEGPEPATGAILAAVETATGVPATVIGKPEPYMFLIARDVLRKCKRVAVIGDNLASDIAGAKRAGLEAVLVLSGASTWNDVAGADYAPDLILDSIADLARAASSDVDERPESDERKQVGAR